MQTRGWCLAAPTEPGSRLRRYARIGGGMKQGSPPLGGRQPLPITTEPPPPPPTPLLPLPLQQHVGPRQREVLAHPVQERAGAGQDRAGAGQEHAGGGGARAAAGLPAGGGRPPHAAAAAAAMAQQIAPALARPAVSGWLQALSACSQGGSCALRDCPKLDLPASHRRAPW